MTRHMFPGANTPNGFYSYFDNILPVDKARKTIYLKGSSGSGKSTFMKKVGKAFEKQGDTVEYLHCSNDADSIDGICIRDLSISIVDGTAPHLGDPSVPIAIDEILNLADFINEEMLCKHRKELLYLSTEKKQFINKTYNYYKAAYNVYLNNSCMNSEALNIGKLNAKTLELFEIFADAKGSDYAGKNRKSFASAVTPFGTRNFIDTILDAKVVYALHGNDGTGTDMMLSDIQQMANKRGFDTESFYCPLRPNKLEHLIIPGMDICFTTVNNYHSTGLTATHEIHFSEFMDMKKIAHSEDEIKYNYKIFDDLLQKTIDTLKASKKYHDRLEDIYIKYTDFDMIDEACENTIKRLKDLSL